MVDEEGGMYHPLNHPEVKYGIFGSALAVKLGDNLKVRLNKFVLYNNYLK